jgi:hypothetical protein
MHVVQFVEFNRNKENKTTSLTEATLDEIPDVVVDYFYHKGIKPPPRPVQFHPPIDISESLLIRRIRPAFMCRRIMAWDVFHWSNVRMGPCRATDTINSRMAVTEYNNSKRSAG